MNDYQVLCSNGHKMVLRTNGATGQEFLGCSHYPECKETRPIPEDIRMRLLGVPSLPGM